MNGTKTDWQLSTRGRLIAEFEVHRNCEAFVAQSLECAETDQRWLIEACVLLYQETRQLRFVDAANELSQRTGSGYASIALLRMDTDALEDLVFESPIDGRCLMRQCLIEFDTTGNPWFDMAAERIANLLGLPSADSDCWSEYRDGEIGPGPD